MDAQSRSIQIQSVLYNNDLAQTDRLIESLYAAYRNARSEGVVHECIYSIGDCSEEPLVTTPDEWMSARSHDSFKVRYEFFGENLGHGGGQNRLFESCTSDTVGIINPDVVASPFLISRLVKDLQGDVGITEAAQIPLEHPKDYDKITRETTFASGCCMFLDSELFRDIGGFDHKTFFMYCDDVDLSWRVRMLGKKIVFVADACVYHDHRIDNDADLQVGHAEFYYSAMGGLLLAYKWNRHDLVEQNLSYMKTEMKYKEVVDEFEERKKLNKLPEIISDDHGVSIFSPTGFAQYRWTN